MSNTIIKLENISKQYRLGTVGSKTLRGDLQRWWYNLRGKEDPTLKIGQSNELNTNISHLKSDNYVWALKDINLEVKQGEVLGIIGKNGAGKSTLLKLLSRVTGPTTGQIKVKGRIASLLEVGTGFHPELTGKENIFLNGAILGMTKPEIRSKFDEIVDFAGVAKYIDTPVKRYSSGMYVRLAFAVAAHLEPDILVVDEVLAVGDAEFQKKAIGKMQDVSTQGGRTVLLVSHNMNTIQRLCRRTILLNSGRMDEDGTSERIIEKYINKNKSELSFYKFNKIDNDTGSVLEVRIEGLNGEMLNEIPLGTAWRIRVKFKIDMLLKHFIIAIGMKNSLEVSVRNTFSSPRTLDSGCYEAIFEENRIHFVPGVYQLIIGLSTYERTFQYIKDKIYITISSIGELNKNENIIGSRGKISGIFLNQMECKIKSVSDF